MKSKNISQQRIARDLGVSQALVSLVLNGKRENISEDSYTRIWDYAVKRGYRPKGMQTNGRHLATTNVGFLLRAGLRLYTQSNFFSHVQHGLHEALHNQGYNTVFLGAEDHWDGDELKARLRRDNLYGVVIMGEVNERFVKQVSSVQSNLVAVSATYPGLCHSVMPNDKQALDLLVDHLVELGHKEFAWVGGNKGLKQNTIRRAAFEEALREKGLLLRNDFALDEPGGDRLDGRRIAETIIKSRARKDVPTAWVCLNGLMARGVINYLTQHDWRVPEEISVAAVDATRVCIEEHPEITGANADPEKMGAKAAELVLSARPEQELVDVVLPARLVARETSAIAC